jgi:8-oxo-dGTP diphosphatase
MASTYVDVAIVAVLRGRPGMRRILLTKRGKGVHLPGMWELPGGRIEPGESAIEAAARELAEETGICVAQADLQPVLTVEHAYPERAVRLHALAVVLPDVGERLVKGLEKRWVLVAELAAVELPAANGPIVDALVKRFS